MAAPVAALAILASSIAASAQVTRIQECATPCPWRLEKVVTLGDSTGRGILGNPASVASLESGEWVVLDHHEASVLKLYAADGRFLRTLGRKGQGPGEFEYAGMVSPRSGDTLDVVDIDLLRITTLTARGQLQRTRRVPVPFTSLGEVGPGRFIVSEMLHGPESVGLPLHVVDETRVIRSFGADPPLEDLRNPTVTFRFVAGAGDGTVWSAAPGEYVLERWDADGQRLARFERQARWFPKHAEPLTSAKDRQPPARVRGVTVDARHGLRVLLWLPDARWREAFVTGRDPYGRPREVVGDRDRYVDSVVEILDAGTGRMLGVARTDVALRGLMENRPYAYSFRTVGVGHPVIDVWRLVPGS